MQLREKVAAIILASKFAKSVLENAENIAPKLPEGKMPFKASPYTEGPQSPKVKVKKEVNVDPMVSPTAKPGASIPIPTVTYAPSPSQLASTPGSMLPEMPPLLPMPGSGGS